MKFQLLVAGLALAAAGCASMVTQSPGQGLSPVNAVADGADSGRAVDGEADIALA